MQDITVSPGLSKLFEEMKRPTQVRQEDPQPPPPEPETIPEPQAEVKPKVEVDKKLIQASAEMAIAMVDGVQASIFKGLAQHRRNIRANEITGDEKGKVKLARAVRNYKQSFDKDVSIITNEETALLELDETVNGFINDLGFTEKQQQQILQPLMYIIEANGGKIPMELWCIIGFGNAIGGNVAGLLAI